MYASEVGDDLSSKSQKPSLFDYLPMVGREVLAPSSAAFQAAAILFQLPTLVLFPPVSLPAPIIPRLIEDVIPSTRQVRHVSAGSCFDHVTFDLDKVATLPVHTTFLRSVWMS